MGIYCWPTFAFACRVGFHRGLEVFARRDVTDILTASDAELVECMAFMASRMKLVVEPTGCLGFAAARQMKSRLRGKRVGVLVSGGNVDLARFCSLVASASFIAC